MSTAGKAPTVDPSAYVAPTAVVCGDVTIGAGARVLFGAVLTAEDGAITVGERCVIMENALIRGRAQHPATIGDDVLIGPHAHVNGTTIEAGCFIATGAALFPGAHVGAGSEVRIHGVVQVNTVLEPGINRPDRLDRGRRPGTDPAAGPPRRHLGDPARARLPRHRLRHSSAAPTRRR